MGVLDMLLVTDAMTTEFPTVRQDVPLEEMVQAARTQSTRSWPVVDEDESLVGIVTVTDIERAIVDRDTEGRTVEEVMTRALVTAKPGDTLRRAFRLFGQRDVHQIPVVDSDEPGDLVGVLRRTEILWAYKELSDEHQRLLDQTGGAVTEAPDAAVQIELQVRKEQSGVCNKRIREIQLPPDVLIVLLRRGEGALVPRGESRLEEGDVLTFLTTRAREPELRDWISRL
jgi:CBS domain-containing protein